MKLRISKRLFLLQLFILIYGVCYGQVRSADGHKIDTTQLHRLIRNQMDSFNIPGLSIVIINKSRQVYSCSFGVKNMETREKVDDQSIFEAGSVSKSVFAYFTLKMVDEGLLALDTPLYKYLPNPDLEFDERYKLITARMVLSHTSGLPNWRFFNEDGKLDIKFTPGTQFFYSGEGYEYLANVLAHLANTDYEGLEKLFRKEIYEPFKMTHSGFILTDDLKSDKVDGYENGKLSEGLPDGLPYFGAAFGFHTDAVDFSGFLTSLLRQKGLKRKTYDEMFGKQVVLPEDESLRTDFGFDAWGLGFIRKKTPLGLMYAHGGMNPSFQSYFMILPARNFGYAFFTNSNTGLQILPSLEQFLLFNGKAGTKSK